MERCSAEKRLSTTEPGKGWVDKRGNVKEGTHIFLNVGPHFDLHGEGALPLDLLFDVLHISESRLPCNVRSCYRTHLAACMRA